MNNMLRCLDIGKAGENIVLSLMEQAGLKPQVVNEVCHDIQFTLNRKKYKCEVKYDIMSEKTGNIAFEYSNHKGDPTGILRTTAHIWAHLVPDGSHTTVWICSVDTIKKLLNEVKPKRIIERAGDGNANIMLYSVDILEEMFSRLDNKSVKDIKKSIKEQL